MKHLEQQERRKYAPPYEPAEVDPEFIPYLERINAKPFAASVQCCIGHCKYAEPGIAPPGTRGFWGYLKLLMTGPSATWLSQELKGREWLIIPLSKMWAKNVKEMPTYTNRCNFFIAFAWDASAWPTPAEEICSLLDKYHAAEPDEPHRLVKFDLPKRRNSDRLPPLRRPEGRRPSDR